MNSEFKIGAIIVIVFIVILLVFIGPSRMGRYWASWRADAYGTDWLVIKEDMMGNTIRYWELEDKSVGSEESSDGIYFKDENDSVVHIAGFYTYVQVMDGDMEMVKKEYLKGID